MEKTNEKMIAHSMLDLATQEKVGNSTPLLGYIRPSEKENSIVLYRDIVNPCDSMEISKNDITHSISAPREILPFEGSVIWVQNNAAITYKRTLKTNPNDIVAQRQAGRLSMAVTNKLAASDCSSHCNGTCEHCTSHCTKSFE